MSEKTFSRRSFAKAAAGVATVSAGGALFVNSTEAASSGFTEVASPTKKTLYGVVQTANGPFAVGKDGNVLTRIDGTWRTVVDDGPHTRNNSMRTVGVSDDGERIWFAGSSGALGAYDVHTGDKYDYSAPKGKTSTWEGISVAGSIENEVIYAANGSGEVLKGTHDSEGCVVWGEVTKPGSGSTIPALDFRESDTAVGHAVDTTSQAYETRDGGDTWEKIGIPDAQVNLYDVISYTADDGTPTVYGAGGDGKIYWLDCDCDNWTPLDVGSATLQGIDYRNDDKIACGAGGNVYEVTDQMGWESVDSPVSADLNEVAYGDDAPDVIVGDSGTILER